MSLNMLDAPKRLFSVTNYDKNTGMLITYTGTRIPFLIRARTSLIVA